MLLNVSTVGIKLINLVLSHFVFRTATFCYEFKLIGVEFGTASNVLLSNEFYGEDSACLPSTQVRTSL